MFNTSLTHEILYLSYSATLSCLHRLYSMECEDEREQENRIHVQSKPTDNFHLTELRYLPEVTRVK